MQKNSQGITSMTRVNMDMKKRTIKMRIRSRNLTFKSSGMIEILKLKVSLKEGEADRVKVQGKTEFKTNQISTWTTWWIVMKFMVISQMNLRLKIKLKKKKSFMWESKDQRGML